jgi:hypothetical protein
LTGHTICLGWSRSSDRYVARKEQQDDREPNGKATSGSESAENAESTAATAGARAAYNDGLQQEILPIPDIQRPGLITYDAKDSDTKYPPIVPLRPPTVAPNVLLILLEDVGFGASSAFGGPCQTPNCERLAVKGLKYERFHTTAVCAPSRAALLDGRNHHSVNMGMFPS